MSLVIDTKVHNRSSSGHRAKFVVFGEGAILNWIDTFSSKKRLLSHINEFARISYSAHDASGKLIAYTKDGKVVICK